jgi:hypothetical protein
MRYRNGWTQLNALATQAQPKVAQMMWERTDLKPKDVDVAELYDGFSFHSINWLEAFAFAACMRRAISSETGHASPWRVNCPLTPMMARCRPGECTLMAGFMKLAFSCAAWARHGRFRAIPGLPRSQRPVDRSRGASSS